MFKTKLALSGAAAIAVAGALTMTALPVANADPSSTPRTYTTVGSDTIQDVWNGLSNGVASVNGGAAVIPDVASWDVSGSSPTCIPGATHQWVRPVGSGNGAKFLSAAYDSSFTTPSFNTCTSDVPNSPAVLANPTSADVSFSRSSAAPSVTGNDLQYIPFARDAVSVAVNDWTATTDTSTTPVDFTANELRAIYGGSGEPSDAHVTYITDAQSNVIGVKVDGTQVFPYLPQSGSGTRQFFLGAIGLSNTGPFPSYVNTDESYVENRGSLISGTDNALVPFSAAQWLAQKNGAASDTITAGEDIATIGGVDPLSTRTGTAGPGALYGSTDINGHYTVLSGSGFGVFARDTYNVIPTDHYTGGAHADATLVADLSTNLDSANARAVIAHYGFGNLAYHTAKPSGWVH